MKKRSNAQEKRVAKILGGRRQPMSGAGMFSKADVLHSRFLVECKTTSKQSYSVTKGTLDKLRQQAYDASRAPVLVFSLDDDRGVPEDWAVIPLNVLKHLLKEDEKNDNE
jgi:hypothetical protein